LAASCSWRPTTRGAIRIYASLKPTSASFLASTSLTVQANVVTRSGNR
jgi:hypothetical protein